MARVEVVTDDEGQPQVEIDGVRMVKPTPVAWRGLHVCAEIDAAIAHVTGKRVFHISIAANRRRPSDDEVQEAIDEWVPKDMRLGESAWVVNPTVRHFFDADALNA